MIIYIPQNIDPYNTHLKNLADAYSSKGIKVLTGYETFITGEIIPDVMHFHQIEGLIWNIKYNQELFFEKLDFYKKQGVICLATAHNLIPHYKTDKINYSDFLNKYFGYIDIFIHHGQSSMAILKKEYPVINDKKHIICHHGDYLSDMGDFHDTMDGARRKLKLPHVKKIVLIFGQLQFKNTGFAEEVLYQLRKKYNNAILLMAGVNPIYRINRLNKLYYTFNNKILNRFHNEKILIYKRFSQFETYLLFTSSDVIFLPHNEGLTTGNIPMAATLGKPFVYPDIGVFSEQAEHCLAEKYECSNVDSAVSAIDRILSSGKSTFDNSIWLENNNWLQHVDTILTNLKLSDNN